MCSPASFVLTKDKVFWSRNSDSHERIIDENNLHVDGVRGPNIVRVEITPLHGDMRKPLSRWKYYCDQDVLPAWYDAKTDEKRARAALKAWAKANLVRAGHRSIAEGHLYATGSASVYATGSSTVHARGSSTVVASGSSTVYAGGSSKVIKWSQTARVILKRKAVLIDRRGPGKPVVSIATH